MILDLNNPISLLRLRCGDTRDIPQLPDEVYGQALTEKKGNLRAAAILCGNYILAQLAFDSHQKMGVIEVWGSEAFNNYRTYLMTVVRDPSFSSISPIPYSGPGGESPIVRFTKDWHKGCYEHCDKGWVKVDA